MAGERAAFRQPCEREAGSATRGFWSEWRGRATCLGVILLVALAATVASSGEEDDYVERQWQEVLGSYYNSMEEDKLEFAYKEAHYLSSVLEVFSMKYGWLPGRVGEFVPWSEVVETDFGKMEFADKLLGFDRDPWHQSFFYGRLPDGYIIVSGGSDLKLDVPYAKLVASGVEDEEAYCDPEKKAAEADVLYQSGAVCPRVH